MTPPFSQPPQTEQDDTSFISGLLPISRQCRWNSILPQAMLYYHLSPMKTNDVTRWIFSELRGLRGLGLNRLVVGTGPTGIGKSTAMAYVAYRINQDLQTGESRFHEGCFVHNLQEFAASKRKFGIDSPTHYDEMADDCGAMSFPYQNISLKNLFSSQREALMDCYGTMPWLDLYFGIRKNLRAVLTCVARDDQHIHGFVKVPSSMHDEKEVRTIRGTFTIWRSWYDQRFADLMDFYHSTIKNPYMEEAREEFYLDTIDHDKFIRDVAVKTIEHFKQQKKPIYRSPARLFCQRNNIDVRFFADIWAEIREALPTDPRTPEWVKKAKQERSKKVKPSDKPDDESRRKRSDW